MFQPSGATSLPLCRRQGQPQGAFLGGEARGKVVLLRPAQAACACISDSTSDLAVQMTSRTAARA